MRVRLRERRIQRGHSLRGLADLAGVSYVTIVRIEAGRMSPTLDMLEKLAEALEIRVADLLPAEPKPKRRARG